MIALLTLAALSGQNAPAVRLELTDKQSVQVEALAEKLCPDAFRHGGSLQWLATVAKQNGLTADEQLLLMSNCVLYSQGRVDEKKLERRRR